MPIRPPALDDRRFADLVDDMLARVPAHVPEWSQPRVGDPGRTLIELFAWLGDTLLYRANLIPEKQRLQFLRLLGRPLRAAVPARGMLAVALDDADPTPLIMRAGARAPGPAAFETLAEATVQPVTAACFIKRRPSDAELATLGPILAALPRVYELGRARPDYYATTPVFADGAAPGDLDLVRETVDATLWFALLARDAASVAAARAAIGGTTTGTAQVLGVGWAPAIEAEALRAGAGRPLEVPCVFELTTQRDGALDYLALERVGDTSQGLTRRGVVRLALPAASAIHAPGLDEDDPLRAGVGDRPPRLDDAALSARLVAWLRLRPRRRLDSLRVAWAGINAVEIDQRRTLTARVFGTSTGQADQEHKLPGESIDPDSLVVQVEDGGRWVTWTPIADLALADRDDEAYQLDPEAGAVRFGDGVRGRIPPAAARIRVERLRAGGGAAGNLPPGTLRALDEIVDATGALVTRPLVVVQPLATAGGQDAETLAEAEQRIPSWVRHRDRAVTTADFRTVAAETPGVALGRVEVLPQFVPAQRRAGVPGVVSVMVWPQQPRLLPPNPRADQPLIEAVHAWLDERRPVATELYVIGCEYVPVAASAGVAVREGAPRDEVLAGVREAVRRFLWPLAPGGAAATGWPLGRAVRQRELEVVVAQVPGVSEVVAVNLFERRDDRWVRAPGVEGNRAIAIAAWQLPELLAVTAEIGEPHDDPDRIPNPYGDGTAIPVVPEVC